MTLVTCSYHFRVSFEKINKVCSGAKISNEAGSCGKLDGVESRRSQSIGKEKYYQLGVENIEYNKLCR